MKKLIFSAFSALLMVSCSEETQIFQSEIGENVSFSINIPAIQDIRTRANGYVSPQFGDGKTVSQLRYYIYDADDATGSDPVISDDISIVDTDDYRGASLNVQLPKDRNFDVVFLATAGDQTNSNSKIYYNQSARTLNVNYDNIASNDESVDCFYGVINDVSSDRYNYSVTLKRPFAQLNIGDKSILTGTDIVTAGVTVNDVYSSMNVMDGSLTGNSINVTFSPSSLPSGYSFPVSDVGYLAMNYLLVNEQKNVDVTLTTFDGQNTGNTEFTEVPLKRNCQTNIYGNLFEAENDFIIEINPDFSGSAVNNNLDDKWSEYDLVMTVSSSRYRTVNVSIYGGDNNIDTTIDLKKYIDSDNYIKVTWDELGINNVKHISFANNSYIESVIKCDINKLNVTDLSNFFYGCSDLNSIPAIKKWDTSEITDMSYMFYACRSLSELDITNFDTHNVLDMSNIFRECRKLLSLNMSNLDTSNVKNMSHMFQWCQLLTDVNLSGLDTSNVEDMSYMFYYCYKLSSLDVSSFDTSKVTDMSYMFATGSGFTYSNSSNLGSLDLSNFNTSNVCDMSYMFSYCSNLTSLNIEGFDTSKVLNMSNMFYGCRSLSSLNVSSFDTSKVTNMSSMFYYCSSSGLSSLDVKNFDTANVTDMSSMFYGCSGLSSLDVTNFDTANVTNMSSMFNGCSGLSSLDVTNFNTANVTNMSNMFGGCLGLDTIDVTNFDTANVTNMSGMFNMGSNSTSKLKSLDLTSFDTSNVLVMYSMFYNCRSLSSLNVSSFDTSKVTDMSYMFYYCSSLTEMDLSNFYTPSVTNMMYMFNNCSSLRSLSIPNFNTSNVTNMTYMFNGCNKITSLDLSSFDISNVTNMLNMFKSSYTETLYLTDWYFCDDLSYEPFSSLNFLVNIHGPVNNIHFDISFINSSYLTNSSAMVLINGLATVDDTHTITFSSNTYETLTEEQIAVATNKGWTVSYSN